MINKFYLKIIISATILNFLFALKNDFNTFEIISNSQNRLHVQFDFKEVDFLEIYLSSQTYLIPQIQNAVYNQKKGFPNLPSLSESVQIPKGKKAIISYKINEYDEFDNVNIAPSKGKITRDKNPNDIKYTFSNIYNSDFNFPEQPVKLDSSFFLRGIHGATIDLIPFSYNSKAKRLIFYKKLDIFIDFVDDVYSNTPIATDLTSPFRNIIENQFINFENTRNEMIPDHGSMIIITDESYLMNLETFIDWKNMKGIPTEAFTTQFIGNSTELIKNFIFNQYIDNQISYVLLVGDTDNVATFWPDGQTPSDLIYGYLDGDDAYPEVLIGRFSAESNEDIQVQVDRVLRYEKYMNTEAEWYNKGIGIASSEGDGIGDDGESDFIHVDNIREKLINYNYISIDQAYDIYNVSPTQVYDYINSGRGIINYTGHGSTNSWVSSGFSIQDINQLNNVDKYPFILSVSCNTGASQFGESMAEAWLNASQNLIPTGAISVAASSSLMQWAPPMECQDEFNDILTKTYEDKQIYSFGGIFYNSIIKMIESYGDIGVEEAKYWHVYGDPSILIRTDVPSIIDVSYSDTLTIGQTSMNLFTDEDGLVATISQNGKILSSSVSQNGLISIPLIELDIQAGIYDLTIVGYNKATYISDIIFTEPEIGLLVVNSLSFNQLNHNLSINSGSDVTVSFDISNEGLESVNQLELKLETEDQFIIIDDYVDSLNQVLINESITHEMHILVANNTPDNHSAFVNLVMKTGELEWIFPFILNIKSPEINVSTSLLSTQDEDRIWHPGDEATLSFVVSNIGSGNMNYPIGFDIEMDENIAIHLNNDYHLEEISYEDIEPVFLNFLSMNDIPLGTQLFLDIQLFELGCESQCRELPNLNIQFTIGNSAVLLWNPSSNSQSSFKLASYLMSQGYGSFDHINSTHLPDLSTYHTAFVFLGVHPNNYHLTQADANSLENILLRSGNIYLEGGDTWFFNESTTLHSFFNIEGISDGSSDLNQIVGGQNTFAEQMTFQYSGESNWIDRLQPIGTAQTLLSNVSPQYSTAIIYEDYTGYKTVGASHELRGLEGEFFDDYLTELISFFDFDSQPICSSGDLNNDILVNVLDVVRLVSIVLGNGPQESTLELCASDLNGDNLFNIMDVVMLVQIVLNSNL